MTVMLNLFQHLHDTLKIDLNDPFSHDREICSHRIFYLFSTDASFIPVHRTGFSHAVLIKSLMMRQIR
jgi:hypothetical protein